MGREAGSWPAARHIVIERENFRMYIPVATSVIISVVLSMILWLLNR
jgi:hypothetical protein